MQTQITPPERACSSAIIVFILSITTILITRGWFQKKLNTIELKKMNMGPNFAVYCISVLCVT